MLAVAVGAGAEAPVVAVDAAAQLNTVALVQAGPAAAPAVVPRFDVVLGPQSHGGKRDAVFKAARLPELADSSRSVAAFGQSERDVDTSGLQTFLNTEAAVMLAVACSHSTDTHRVKKQVDLVSPNREWSCIS